MPHYMLFVDIQACVPWEPRRQRTLSWPLYLELRHIVYCLGKFFLNFLNGHCDCQECFGNSWDVFLRSEVCVCVLLHPTVCDPVDCSPPGSSVHGTLQARILEWVAMPSSRTSSWYRDRTPVSCVSCIGRRILYHWEPPGQLQTHRPRISNSE